MPALEALIDQLSDEQLVGLCRLGLNQPVPASDVPAGVPTPGVDQIAVLIAEVGRRRVMGPVRRLGPDVMGAAEAAEALGVTQTNLRMIEGLPDPIATVRATSLWDGAAIRELAAKRAARE